MSSEEPPVPEEVLTSAKDELDEEEISLADNEEIAWLRLGDADEEGHDVGDQAELLDAVVPLPSDVDHPESVGVLPAVEAVYHKVQPPDRLPAIIPEHEVRPVVL